MSKIKKKIDSEKEILFREAGREAVEAAEQNFFQPVLSVAIVIQTVETVALWPKYWCSSIHLFPCR